MHRRRLTCIFTGLALTALAGCVQATRHSNTMLFGTNTSFGIKVGTATGQVPGIVVGYDRQEAVVLPLVANVTSTTRPNGEQWLDPCDLTKDLNLIGDQPEGYLIHPCSLVAYKAGSLDSYSVLASFGAKFSAKAEAQPSAEGGLAQYFATGMAAQILAAKGGAALVSTGEGAKESAQTATPMATLFPEGTAFAHARAVAFDSSIQTLRDHITETTDPAILARKINKFLVALESPYLLGMKDDCTTSAKCVSAMEEDVGLLHESPKLPAAIAAWNTY